MKPDTGMGTGTDIVKKKPTGRPKGSKCKNGYNMSKKTELAKKKNVAMVPFLTEEEQAYNTKLIEFSLLSCELSKTCDRNDPESLHATFLNYVRLCIEKGFRVSNIGACTALGISYDTLKAWASGYRKGNEPGYKELATFVMSVCAVSREQLVIDQKVNPVIGIFWQRNFDGLRNDTEQQQQQNGTEENENMTASDYQKKYGKLREE